MTVGRILRKVVPAFVPLVGACTSFGPTQLDRVDRDERVILSSGRPFALHTEVAGVKAACISHEVSGRVVRRASDTLYLSVSARRAVGADEPTICALPLSGFVVMTPSVDIKGRQIAVLPTVLVATVIGSLLYSLMLVLVFSAGTMS